MSAFITGIGIISPIGCDCATVLESLRQKCDGIGTATKIDASKFHSQICGEVHDFDCASNMSQLELETYTDPFIRFAINAGRMAVRNAGLEALPKSTAIVVASCNAGMNSGVVINIFVLDNDGGWLCFTVDDHFQLSCEQGVDCQRIVACGVAHIAHIVGGPFVYAVVFVVQHIDQRTVGGAGVQDVQEFLVDGFHCFFL